MHHIAICGLPRSTTLFPRYLIKGRVFKKKKVIEHKMCDSSFSITFVLTFFILRRNVRDMIENVYRFSCKVPVFLSHLVKLEISQQTAEKYPNIKLMKIRPEGAELLHADRRTDVTKFIVAFRYFANESKKKTEKRQQKCSKAGAGERMKTGKDERTVSLQKREKSKCANKRRETYGI